MRKFVVTIALACSLNLAHAINLIVPPDCAPLLLKSIRGVPEHLTPLTDADVHGLPFVARVAAGLQWTIPGPVKGAELLPKLHLLMQHVVSLSLKGTGREGLFEEVPEYRDYLNRHNQHIDRLIQAWTDPETGDLDLVNQALPRRAEIMELQKLDYQDTTALRQSVSVTGSKMYADRLVVPTMSIAGVPLKWTVSLVAAADGKSVRIVVNNSRSQQAPSEHPEPVDGVRQLALYGKFGRLFGLDATPTPAYHQRVFFENLDYGKMNFKRVFDAIETATKESRGKFDRKSFAQAIIYQANLRMLHFLCGQTQMCRKLNENFVKEYEKSFETTDGLMRDPDGTLYTADNHVAFEHLFRNFSDTQCGHGDTSTYRLAGWYGISEFLKHYLDVDPVIIDYNMKRMATIGRMQQMMGGEVNVGASPHFDENDMLLSGRVAFGVPTFSHQLDFSSFEVGKPVEQLAVKSMFMSFAPTAYSLRRGDLEENHFRALINRIQELLDIK